jgi:methyl-accepting chemotaxis protein
VSLSNRLALGFAAIIAVLFALGIGALLQFAAIRSTVDRIVDRDLGAINQLAAVEDGTRRMVELRTAAVRRFLLDGGRARTDQASGAADWRRQTDLTQRALSRLREAVATYRDQAVNRERTEQWVRISILLSRADGQLARLRDDVELSFTAIEGGDLTSFERQEGLIGRDRAELLSLLEQVRRTVSETVQTGRKVVADSYERSRIATLLAMALAVAIAIAVALALRRAVVGPLDEFGRFVADVGQGELGALTTAGGPAEIARLGASLNAMTEGLRTLARSNREATANLNASATEIRASTQEQAASVEEQLAAVQETAATVDEITHSGSQITRRAQEVIAAAQVTAQSSGAGLGAVQDTVRAMDLIREQAERVAENIVQLSERTEAIGEIIATVNEVSERSHILALNASIEAAAAGEAGRGFAVVATEMKSLADQAKDATREVRGILGNIQRGISSSVMLTEEAVKRVTAGRERTRVAQSTIEEMGGRIQESIQTFQQIVASTAQQQIGIEQVTLALQNIRQASQQTAASTRQLDQAAGNLAGLAEQLVGLTGRYRF